MKIHRDNRCRRAAGLPRPASGLRRAGALTVALGVALAPVAAPAQPEPLPTVTDEPAPPPAAPPANDSQADRAMTAYQRGTRNYNLAQYEAALADFKEAASLYASPDFQYNIGLCYEKLGKYDEAIRAFATYLKAKPNAEDRPNVENRIRELQRDIEREKRDAEDAAAKRQAQAEREPPPQEPTTDEPPGHEGRTLVIAGAALVGVGAAVALGGGIGFGVAASDQSLFVDEIQTGGNPEGFTFAEAEAFEADGQRFEAIQVGMAAAGSVVAVTGAVLLALGLRKRNKTNAGAQTARVQARAGAFVGPHRAAGLTLAGRF